MESELLIEFTRGFEVFHRKADGKVAESHFFGSCLLAGDDADRSPPRMRRGHITRGFASIDSLLALQIRGRDRGSGITALSYEAMGKRLVKSCESRKLIDHQQVRRTWNASIKRSITSSIDSVNHCARRCRPGGRLSPFHFHRIFQALSGETPGDFVKRLRLEKALGMMAHARTESLTSIALACGFTSSSDFSRCFKQRFGVPPSVFDIDAWREACRRSCRDHPRRGRATSLRSLPPRHNPDQFRVRIPTCPRAPSRTSSWRGRMRATP